MYLLPFLSYNRVKCTKYETGAISLSYFHIFHTFHVSNKKLEQSRSFQNIVGTMLSAILVEPVHEISNNVVCATSKGSDQPAHTRSLIRVFASRLSIL